MVNPISNLTQTHAAATQETSTATTQKTSATTPSTTTPSTQSKTQSSSIPVDTVQISAAAKALQEITESPAQTSKEAASGDVQAQHLLAKEKAAEANG